MDALDRLYPVPIKTVSFNLILDGVTVRELGPKALIWFGLFALHHFPGDAVEIVSDLKRRLAEDPNVDPVTFEHGARRQGGRHFVELLVPTV